MKTVILSLMFLAFAGRGQAAGRIPPPPPPESLSEAQKACLAQRLGTPGQSPIPPPPKLRAALEACGVHPPAVNVSGKQEQK